MDKDTLRAAVIEALISRDVIERSELSDEELLAAVRLLGRAPNLSAAQEDGKAAAGAADDLPHGWKDILRHSKADTDYHGRIAFTGMQLQQFVSGIARLSRAQAAQQESSDADAGSQGYEARHAIMEAERNAAAGEYFQARPQLDYVGNRRIFEAGFQRGFERTLTAADAGGLPIFCYTKTVHDGWQEFNKINEFSDGSTDGEPLVKLSSARAVLAFEARPSPAWIGAGLGPKPDQTGSYTLRPAAQIKDNYAALSVYMATDGAA